MSFSSLRAVVVAALLGAAGCGAGNAAAPYELSGAVSAVAAEVPALKGSHFDVVWAEGLATADDAKRTLDRAETSRARLVELLGADRVGERRIRIRLAGEGSQRAIPTVEPDTGDIVLYRFPGAGGEYEAPLAHELVHAIRRSIWTRSDRQTDAALFWEEGFAEVLAREAGFPSGGFPLYGVEPDVGAAAFAATHEALPITTLLAQHRSVNFRCMAQAYVERIAFMAYVRRRVGLAPMIDLAYRDAPLDVSTVEKGLGASIADLAAAHDKQLVATASRAGGREALATYRETTPIRYLPVCPVLQKRRGS